MRIGAGTRLVGLLGHPVGHSLSPVIHNAAFTEAGVDAVYLAFDVPPERLAQAVAGLRAAGVLGLNATVPHKLALLELADQVTPEAAAIGAANTLFWRDGTLVADNTDAAGLAEVLAGFDLGAGDRVVLLGSGGAARAAAVALGRYGAAVTVVARRLAAAGAVLDLAEAAGATAGGVAGIDEAGQALTGAALVVNATSLGLRGEPLPPPFMALRADQAALDLVYGRAPTPFVVAAAAAGCRAEDGVGMLVAQAALAFERWTGRDAPRAAMAAAVAGELARG